MNESKQSIWAKENPYGYRLNVNHPWINRQYERYKKEKREIILSDAQRLEFEDKVIEWLKNKSPEK